MSDIIPFDFEENAVRVVTLDEAPWFVAADVCRVLEIVRTDRAVSGLDDDEKGTHIVSTLGGRQTLTIVSESGLYALVLRSRKPAAKRFRKWITSQVIPAIRRTGRYEGGVSKVYTHGGEPDMFAASAERVSHVAAHLDMIPEAQELALRATHLPIWRNGRRPPWWHDIEVRTFLTKSHRQMSTLECERIGAMQFGVRCPKKSAIHAYWQRLDKVVGPLPRRERAA